ncbi:MAG: phosphoribosylamine--glycine ligase [Acidobacteria bacterium]|nr:MAG: phosphoribosylamine--glycine ligase [Acidobacteriota bacterium]
MRILVIGSGGREHAICYSFARSSRVEKIFCAPGNAGVATVAECIPIKPEDIDSLIEFAARESIDLTFVGGETALALGIVDQFEKRGLKIIGASMSAARLEASKAFAKDFMARHGVPTAKYVTADSPSKAIEILESGHFGDELSAVVVKADGLAAGKGVVVARDRSEAIAACGELVDLVGDAAEQIVLEECLIGREVSLLMFVDGNNFALMPPVRDHKRIGEHDTGPNTGGMGTITDSGLLTPKQSQEIIEDMIEPTLAGCLADGFPFRGILFLGLMLTDGGAKLLEYNVRFGDPETQSILVRLETDLVDICEAMLEGKLAEQKIEWSSGNSACVVLAAEGYPLKPRTGDLISGLDDAASIDGVTIFHAGTAISSDGDLLTAGGRVLGVTARGVSLEETLRVAYAAAERVSWSGMQYRRDIGKAH